jgi:CUG-BP- and ETR3-like factor
MEQLTPVAVVQDFSGGGAVEPPRPLEKEPDTLKLFVGQVPKTFEEKDLRPYLEQYGPVLELSILRDKLTKIHKGCAFVTYVNKTSAEHAQAGLHDKVLLPGMTRPLQVKPAGSDARSELRKVFVGMLSKTCTEDDVRLMFEAYGVVEEVTVLRDKEGQSKGCAFIKFSNRQQAQMAINKMHGSQVMAVREKNDCREGVAVDLVLQGASSPLVVKYADTEKERQARRMQKAMQQFAQLNIAPAAFPLLSPQYPYLYAQLIQQQAAVAGLAQASAAASPYAASPLTVTGLLSPTSPSHHGVATVSPLGSSAAGTPVGLPSPGLPPSMPALSPNGLPSSEAINSPLHSPIGTYSTGIHGYTAYPYSSMFGGVPQTPPPPQKEGPEGCNLFIYHLPQDFGDTDLYHLFVQFGNIISAKVFIDKATQQSKCFGFVSYDNPASAQGAISVMNGYSIGSKKLKVQLKRPKEPRRPAF